MSTGGIGVIELLIVLLIGVALIALIVGLVVIGARSGRAGILALGLGLLGVLGFLAFAALFFAGFSTPVVVSNERSAVRYVSSPPRNPKIEMGELPLPEVSEEWSETSQAATRLSHGEIDLSTIPAGYPDWVDQTEGNWDSKKKVWCTTVMVGPYETPKECEQHFREHVREAVAEFAEWRSAQLTDAGHYDRNTLPLPEAKLNYKQGWRTHNQCANGAQLYAFSQGSVSQTYHTKSNTGVSDKPWPVVFARVALNGDFQRKVDRHLYRGRSVRRALRAGAVWGVTLLGMVLALGGLKLTESNSTVALETPLASEAPNTSAPLAKSTTSAPSVVSQKVIRKRWGVIIAPLICTAIFLMQHQGVPFRWDAFWPKWVWFGCALGFLSTFKPFSEMHSKS